MKKIFAPILVAFSLLVMPAMATTITFYNDFSAWKSAAGSYQTEDFVGSLNSGLTITSPWSNFTINNGVMQDRLSPGRGSTLFTFDSGIFAFGGFWDLAGPGGVGTGLKVTLSNNVILSQEISRDLNNSFWGFVADKSFVSVALSAGSDPRGAAETYNINGIYYTQTGNVAVSEPAAFMLFGLSLLALAVRRKFL